METKAHLCFLKKVGGRCGCVYGTKGAADRKSLGTAGVDPPKGIPKAKFKSNGNKASACS